MQIHKRYSALFRSGAHGFCGVMSNFPFTALWYGCAKNFKEDPDTAEYIQSVLGISAFVENVLAYPVIAKYHLDRHEGVNMEMFSLSRDCNELTDYQKGCIDQLNTLITVVVEGLDIA